MYERLLDKGTTEQAVVDMAELVKLSLNHAPYIVI